MRDNLSRTSWGGVLEVYLFPGKVFLWIRYMFPGQGYSKTRQGARWARSPIMTAIVSFFIWGLIIIVAYDYYLQLGW